MLIVRNSVRLSALVAGLALAGCGTAAGGGDCTADAFKVGCVAILNFRATTQLFGGVSVPPRHPNAEGHTEPGKAGVMVSDTSVGSKHDYEGPINGQNVKVTCTVTNLGWTEGNPEVVIQQEGIDKANCGPTW